MTSYDFIIVGGGTSGLTLAARLSENPDVQILVLEAGKDQTSNPLVQTPAFYTACFGTEVDWNFATEPQLGLAGRRIQLNQGKALGGTSAINAQVFAPPSRALIDAWETLGNPGWSWNMLKPYFKKIYTKPLVTPEAQQTFAIPKDEEETAGQIQMSYPPDSDPVATAWIQTFKELGHVMASDPFSGAPNGAFIPLASVNPSTATRNYAATTYYETAKARPNLHVLTDCLVEKVVFDGIAPNLRATGVQYSSPSNNSITAIAAREVIIAAGALQSPKILELSGVGGSALLESLNIPVLVDNSSVGENLQDHIISGIGFEAKEGIPTKDGLRRQEPAALKAAMDAYTTTKSGLLSTVGISSYAYLPLMNLNTPDGQDELKALLDKYAPDSEHTALSKQCYDICRSMTQDPSEASSIFLAFNVQAPFPTVPLSGPQPGNYISIAAVLAHPFSRGSVHITSNDAKAAPAIDPRYLSHPVDKEVFGRHMHYIHTIAQCEPFKSSLLKDGGRLKDAASNFTTVDGAKAYAETSSISMWHPSCTCAMLPEKDGGVVDSELRVYGTLNLRVIDASIFPLLTRGNPQATVYAVAERAADFIKRCYGL